MLESREQLSVEEYETFFNRFDNQEFDFERELTQDPYSKVYLYLSLIHISEPTRRLRGSRMPSSA